MKKLILSAAAFTMLLASCAKDEAVVTSNEALVKFNVAAAEMGTRVYGDGVTAHDLEYAIYEKGSYAQPLISRKSYGAFAGSVMETSFTEKLVKGKTYIALFWADANVNPYTVDWANQTVKIEDPAALVSQDENLDAFFKCHEIVVGQDAQTETVELKRPFAQLNIGTSDTEAAEIAGLVVANTEVSVRAYTTLNLLTGEVADAMQLTYALNAIPTDENATFTINGKTYDHLSMNYLLVNAKELVDVTFTVNDGTQNINTSTFAKVPVQRNYKTFIVGELLTSDVNFEVFINPEWMTPDYIYPEVEEENNVVTEDVTMSEDAENLGEEMGGSIVISDKVFQGTVTIDEDADDTYTFTNVTFEKTLVVNRGAGLYFEDVNFASPAINWNGWNRRTIYLRNCTVDGVTVTDQNARDFFGYYITVNVINN